MNGRAILRIVGVVALLGGNRDGSGQPGLRSRPVAITAD